jgi:DNA-binding transcriptional MerR regulator
MKKEFSQMAFDFPMAAETQAPPKNGLSTHPREQESSQLLSAEQEHAVREEGRRAGVVVRIKSLKRSSDQVADPGATTAAITAPPVATATIIPPSAATTRERIFIQTSIPLEDIDLPLVRADIPAEADEFPKEEIAELTTDLVIAEMAPGPEMLEEVPGPAMLEETPGPGMLEEAPEMLAAAPEPAPIEGTPVEDALDIPVTGTAAPDAPHSASSPVELEEPPLPPRKRSATRPAASAKAKQAPAEKAKSKRGRKSLKEVAAEADLIDIPADEVLFSKQYYTMGEVAEMFKVNQSLLRFWETEFSILQPRKNRKGDRYFRPVDIKNLHLIYHLLRQRKYTIEGAKEFLRKNKKAEQRFDAIQRLQQIKAFLLELKAQM